MYTFMQMIKKYIKINYNKRTNVMLCEANFKNGEQC